MRLDVSSESSARQRIHMKNQALFSSKDKRKKLKCRLLHFLFGALRVSSFRLFVHQKRLLWDAPMLMVYFSQCRELAESQHGLVLCKFCIEFCLLYGSLTL